MKNALYTLVFCFIFALGMDVPGSVTSFSHMLKKQRRERKSLVRATRFIARLAYFKTPYECYNDMTTDSNADSEYDERLITKDELIQWKTKRAALTRAHDLKIQQGKKNESVASVLNNTNEEQKKSLYAQLISNDFSHLSTQEALKALGYEADAE